MVYIFGGIDFPVFELLLVVSMVMLVGLVIIVIGILSVVRELRTLKKLLSEEETDIKEFEKDIGELEQFEGKTNDSKEVEDYINKNIIKGFNWDAIRKSLVGQGYSNEKLDRIYQKMKK
jgi:predicted Holliday junction resolvase-like endonuclease